MLTCLALAAALNTSGMTEIPNLASVIEGEARALAAETQMTPDLLVRIDRFSSEAERLSGLLAGAGVDQDMPCIFHSIAKDAQERVRDFSAAGTQAERDSAFMNLRVLMDDAALLAPLAATAADHTASTHDIALR